MPHPSTSSAYGIWSLNEVRDAVRGENWPTEVPITWTIPAISSATYDSVSVDTTANGFGNPNSIKFSPDGLNFYIADSTLDDIGQYTMTTAFDISTASYTTSYASTEAPTTPQFAGFNADGTKAYIASNTAVLYQYSLSTAYDISSATYDSVSLSTNGNDFWFSPDGTILVECGSGIGGVASYNLSTPFDLSTATSSSQSFDATAQDASLLGVAFNPQGTQMFIAGAGNDAVFQYSLSTAWDVSSASYDSISFSIASQETIPQGITFSADGSKMYITGSSSDDVHQYSTGL